MLAWLTLVGVILLIGMNMNEQAAIARLTASVAQQRTITESVVTLLAGVAEELRNIDPDDTEALDALADSLDDNSQELADAVRNFPTGSGALPESDSDGISQPGTQTEPTDDTSTSEQPVDGAAAGDSVDSGNSDVGGADTSTTGDPSGASDESTPIDGNFGVTDTNGGGGDAPESDGEAEAAASDGDGSVDLASADAPATESLPDGTDENNG